MSEYQRYEFMTCDRPLTSAQMDEVNGLSSHIEASATHALIEYNWGDFKYDPLWVLRKYFDGFLYWANWGSPRFALRFPHGALPADLLAGYDFDDLVTFTRGKKFDTLDIAFDELEGPDEWIEYQLGDMIAIRDELMEGDLRSLYIVWLAAQQFLGNGSHQSSSRYDEDWDDEDEDEDGWEDEEDEEEEGDEEDEDEELLDEPQRSQKTTAHGIPPVPANFGKLTAAQAALAELLQLPSEVLQAAARHSPKVSSKQRDDFAPLLQLLSPERKDAYLLRLLSNEPGLSRLLIAELRELDPGKPTAEPTGERVSYTLLRAESTEMKAQAARERRAREEAARLRRLQEIHAHQDTFWRQVEQATARQNSSGYNEALQGLIDLRDAARHFHEEQTFLARFDQWVQAHTRRPALMRRLQEHDFPLP